MDTKVCPAWLSFFLENGIRKKIHNPEKMLREYVTPGCTAIDIGCGPGYFSIPMAEMTGKGGKVISVDIQHKMLKRLRIMAKRHYVEDIIHPAKCTPEDISVNEKADFILTFWMVHEVNDVRNFMTQIVEVMKPSALYLLSEPKIHVTDKKYREIIETAESVGLKKYKEQKIWGSHSMLFTI
jgi:2-polyprenyl-3-methyl-5-hydroxy-6-metoxy-1,4-benzoquinol methylase